MPGPNGISGNTPYIINLSDPRIVGNVGEVQPGGATPKIESQPGVGTQAPVLREPVRAADVAGQLDVLLLKAAKSSAGEVDVKAVASAAKSAKLPQETRDKLENLAKKMIDNDASYGIFRQGLYKFRMQPDSVMNMAFNEAIDKKFGTAGIAGKAHSNWFDD